MGDFVALLFDSTDFPARWHCGNWTEVHGWIHVLSDIAVFGAYMAIPIALAAFIRRRRDLPFPWIFWMFVAFICSCGVGHLVEAIIFWKPIYRVSGMIKLCTAIVSWVTVGALIHLLPVAMRLRSPEELEVEIEKRTREAREAQAFKRAILDAAPIGMLVANAEGEILFVNEALLQQFGYSQDELEGKKVEMLVPPRFRSGHGALRAVFALQPSARMMGAGRAVSAVRKDGTEFDAEIGLNPVELPEGTGVVASVSDITERNRAAERLRRHAADLERVNAELDEFAYVASHDLRTPLDGVKTVARWIIEDNADTLSDRSKRHLQQMQQRIERMERLLDDLLHYSRVGRTADDVGQVEPQRLLRDIVELLSPPDGFEVEIDADAVKLETARTPLQQVLLNLINNAIKHHDADQGLVKVSCRDKGDMVEFIVVDDGPGIEPRFHQQVFKMFATLRPRDEVEGSGMGLALVQKIVKNHGGKVTLESDGSRGTTFRVTWPKRPVDVGGA